jgi:hypothetical protein
MNKFKVGDKLRVRRDLELHRRYGQEIFTQKLEQYRGVETIVVSIESGFYELDCNYSFWCEEMLEPIISLKERLKEFTIVKFRSGTIAIALYEADKIFFYAKEHLLKSNGSAVHCGELKETLESVKVSWLFSVDAFKTFSNSHEAITSLLQEKSVMWDWERTEVKKMTQSEIEEELGYPIEIVEDKKA